MNIRVADRVLGECNIKINDENIGKREQYLIKSLSILQIMCMNSQEDPEKFKEFTHILKDATKKIENLFDGNNDKEIISGTEDFGD